MSTPEKTPEEIAAEQQAAAAAQAQKDEAARLKKEKAEADKKAKADKKAADKKAADEKKAADAQAKKDKAAADKQAKADAAAKKKADAEQAKKDAEAAKEANKQPEQNGVRRPKPDTLCGKAWAIMDAESAKLGSPVPIKELLAVTNAAGLNEGNVRAEYARWRKFFGVSGRIVTPKPEVAPAQTGDANASATGDAGAPAA